MILSNKLAIGRCEISLKHISGLGTCAPIHQVVIFVFYALCFAKIDQEFGWRTHLTAKSTRSIHNMQN